MVLSITIPKQSKNTSVKGKITTVVNLRPQRKKPRRRERKRHTKGRELTLVRKHHSMLSGPGSLFLAAVSNPFHAELRGRVYRPDGAALPSWKQSFAWRNVVTVASGASCIIFPNPSINSTAPSVFMFNGTPSAMKPTTATGYSSYTAPLTYSSAAIPGAQVNVRPVLFGMRVRYTGSVINRGGTAIWLNDIDSAGELILDSSESLTAFSTLITRWISWPTARLASFVNKDSHDFVLMASQQSGNYGFIRTNRDATDANAYPWSSDAWSFNIGAGAYTTSTPPAVLVLQNNNSTTALEFTIEYIYHVEYNGGVATPMHTPSVPHIDHHEMITDAYEHASNQHASTPDVHHSELMHAHLDESFKRLAVKAGTSLVEGIESLMTPSNAARAASGLASLFL